MYPGHISAPILVPKSEPKPETVKESLVTESKSLGDKAEDILLPLFSTGPPTLRDSTSEQRTCT